MSRTIYLTSLPGLSRVIMAIAMSAVGTLGAQSLSHAADPVVKNPVDYVDPFIGTGGDGNVYPGVTLPFGFIQVGPDTATHSGAAGYKINKKIDGFSQQHISGMGGPIYGEISIFPLTGNLENPSKLVSTDKSEEAATPGYYTVKLAPWNVKTELTATRHVAFHRHTFPANEASHIVVDVGHVLQGINVSWNSAIPIGGEVHVDAGKQEVSGFMLYKGGRDQGARQQRTWKVYFSSRTDIPFDSFGTWDDSAKLIDGSTERSGSEIGAYLNFKTKEGQIVNSKIAVSFHSVDQARGYLAAEAPAWNFDEVRQNARAEWSRTLDNIQVEGGTDAQRTMFYTALYRAHLTPNNWTGEEPAHYAKQPYYENILCMWDTFRTINPLLTLIQPKVQTDIVNTLLSYYKNDGWTGDAHSAYQYEHVQNGSSADIIIADAYVKKLPGIDWKLAYEAIRKNAFVDPDPTGYRRTFKGRFRLDGYRQYGYLPTDITVADTKNWDGIQAVSRTLEFVYNDYAVLTLAKKYGTPADVADLESRMLWYKNVWDKDTKFMRGKNKEGVWHTPFEPTKPETGMQYYEGHAWTWSWYVPHDTQGLINLYGGNKPFIEKLTTAVENYYEAYNEPGMLETYLFTHAGRPDQTQHYLRKALSNFTTAANGLPGNDDSGTTSAWLVWAMLGIYPNAGQDYYYIGSPVFSKATVKLADGKQLVINAPGTSAENEYINTASLNGKPWNKAWLRHSDLINGAELTVKMAAKASSWGSQTPPPSLSKPAQ